MEPILQFASTKQESELLSLLLDNVRDYSIFVLDSAGNVQAWNQGAERMFGYREAEIIGQSAHVFFTPDAIQAGALRKEMDEALLNQRASDDCWLVRNDGSRFWANNTLAPLLSEGGRLRGFAKIVRDQTESKQSEERRQAFAQQQARRQRLYDSALANTPDLIYVFGLDHRFTYANKVLLQMWGKTWDEAIGKTCLELGYEPWHAAMHDREIEQVVATKQSIKGEVPFKGTFGRRIYEYIFVPVLDEKGEVEAVAGTTRDVTERRDAEERVRQSERFHRAISELSTDYAFDGKISVDGMVQIERVTAGFANFYGLTMEEMNAQGGWGSVIHPDDHSVVGKTIERLLAGETDRGEVRGIHSDGSFKWQSFLTVPIKNPESGQIVGLYGAAKDITSQRHLTEQLTEQAESLSAILSATVDNIYLLDKEGRYRYASVGGAKVLGLEPSQMTGKHWRELGLPAEIMEPFDAHREAAIGTGNPQRHHVAFTDQKGNHHHYEYNISPVRGAGGDFDAVVVVSRDETERMRAEAALEGANAILRSFYETAPVMMGVVEVSASDVLHLTDNAATGRFFGVSPELFAGKLASELGVAPKHLREWIGRYQESERSGQPIRFEYQHETIDDTRWVSAIVYCIERLPDGNCRCSYVAEDITKRKRVEESLKEAERRWRDLAEALPNLVWTDRPDGQCDYLSSQWETYTGIPVQELLGMSWIERVLHPDDRERTHACWMTAVTDRGPYDLEFRIRRHDGKYRWFKTRGVPVRDQAGRIVKWFGTCTDIEDQKRAEEELRRSQERFSQFMRHLPGLVWVKDSDGKYVYANNAALNAFDVSWNELCGKKDIDLFPDRTAIQFQENDKRALSSENGIQVVEQLEQAGGEVRYSIVSKFSIPERDGGPKSVGGVAIDITELKRAEEALKDADRLKDEFLAILAHELRNPLAPIRNALQILKMPGLDLETANSSREMMERQVQHLVRLVDDLLDVSRVMRGKIELRREQIELKTVVARSIESVQPIIDGNSHTLITNISSGSILLDADPVRLAQIIGNLLTNAAKYMEPSGQIWLSVGREEDTAVLKVKDSGIGIAPEMLPRIFELFVQADHSSTKSQGGLGIGLTIVKNLVKMHGGTVEAYSDGLGKGSEFVVRLPLAIRVVTDLTATSDTLGLKDKAKSGYRLLVVDDNKDAANSLALVLRLQGHEARVAHSGMEALETTKTYVPDVVFLDIGMPEMDGYEVARRMRQQPGLENVVLAAVTGWGQQEDRRRTSEAGFNHHLVKPAQLSAVENVLAQLKQRTTEVNAPLN
jgi:PAS domain S-box-containing protein